MKIQQILQKCLTDWKNISQIDFCLLDSDNHIFLSTCDKKLPAESKLEEFRQSSALCVSNTSCCLYKIMENHSISYILIVWGKAESTATIGELAVCQVQSLLAAYAEKSDKNTFMQNLLLGSYSDVDAFNCAKKLHIATSVQRSGIFSLPVPEISSQLLMIQGLSSSENYSLQKLMRIWNQLHICL